MSRKKKLSPIINTMKTEIDSSELPQPSVNLETIEAEVPVLEEDNHSQTFDNPETEILHNPVTAGVEAPLPEPVKPLETDPLQPASIELKYGDKENKGPGELTREVVESSVRKKLAKKTDEEHSDPFVPQAQLDNEVVQVAREKGFPLSRGTEIGARLLARSKRPY